MARVTQNHSQLLFTYGPGAMVDLPDQAVIISGLEDWNPGTEISEPRLSGLLQQLEGPRAAMAPYPTLRKPPVDDEERHDDRSPAVQARVFPEWFLCDAEANEAPDGVRGETRRRLVRFEDVHWGTGARPTYRGDGRPRPVNPIRFVAACQDGHLQDIDWRRIVHRDRDPHCRQPMYWVERGVSADPGDISIRCTCGASVTVGDLYRPGFIGQCGAFSPWLTPRWTAEDHCPHALRLLPRSATNAYFPQTVTVISMPVAGSELDDVLERHWGDIAGWLSNPALANALESLIRSTASMAPDFARFSDEDLRLAIARRREARGEGDFTNIDPRIEEFDRFSTDAETIGRDGADSRLYGERVRISDLEVPARVSSLLAGIVRVHRLREVACLYGFTRIAAAPTALESELDEITLAVEGAPLSRNVGWFPATEQFGEGIFVRFDSASMERWQASPAVQEHTRKLQQGEILEARRRGRTPEHLGPAYWAIHSLSHAVMAELALDSGYPLSSLKERVYASKIGGTPRHGMLVYTSTAGGQGTLGGLSQLAERMPALIDAAIERLSVCSNDPICSEHEPDDPHDDRHLLGAACHACLLVPETTCEARNGRLDRVFFSPGHPASLIA